MCQIRGIEAEEIFRPQFFFHESTALQYMAPDFRGIADARSALTDIKKTHNKKWPIYVYSR